MTYYNATAFDMAQEVNKLSPLLASGLQSEACPIDVVCDFEDKITQRKPLRFFAPEVSQNSCSNQNSMQLK